MESLAMNPQFWIGKKVFLTGHTGFKGSWLCLWLQSLGAEVRGYALESPSTPSLFELAHVSKGMSSIIADVRDLTELNNSISDFSPSIVIHMAAQPLVREAYVDPVNTYAINVMGTVNVLEAVRKCMSVRAVINVTTDKIYENKERLQGYAEGDQLGGFDPYSNSKACSELVTSAYRSSFFNPDKHRQHRVALASARAGNVIGGGDWAKARLIPDILQSIADRKSVPIRYPNSIRPWQHVLEPLNGYLTLAERLFESGPEFSEAWNFGPSDEDARTVSWIADKICNMWGDGATWHAESGDHPHEAGLLKLETTKARSRLHWHPLLDLEESLRLVIKWSRQYQQGVNARQICNNQILQYQTLMTDFKL
jgi:CDP-glucose 4,6-dehydratase